MSDPNPYESSMTPPTKDGPLTNEDRTWGMLAHLSPFAAGLIGLPFLGPLVIWLVYKDKSRFVEDQSKEALNFNLSVLIAALVLSATCIGLIALPVVLVAGIIYPIIGAIEANKGVLYRYPYTFRMIN